jgi:hypothetical protein
VVSGSCCFRSWAGVVVVPVSIIFLTSSTISDLFLHLKPQGLKESRNWKREREIRKKMHTRRNMRNVLSEKIFAQKGLFHLFRLSFTRREMLQPNSSIIYALLLRFLSAYWLREWKIIFPFPSPSLILFMLT